MNGRRQRHENDAVRAAKPHPDEHAAFGQPTDAGAAAPSRWHGWVGRDEAHEYPSPASSENACGVHNSRINFCVVAPRPCHAARATDAAAAVHG
jgi:hypothetical protein